jgi:subtilisin family serine protease
MKLWIKAAGLAINSAGRSPEHSSAAQQPFIARSAFIALAVLLLASASVLTAQSAQPARPVRSGRAGEQHVHRGVIRVKLAEKPAARLEAQIEKQPVALRQQGLLQSSVASQPLNTGTSRLNKKLQTIKAQKMRRMFPYHPRYEARQRAAGLHLWYEVEIDTTISPLSACVDLVDDDVTVAEPVLKKLNIEALGKKQSPEPGKTLPLNDRILPVQVVTRNNTPTRLASKAQATPLAAAAGNYEDNPPVDDPYLLLQWHYYNYGQVFESSMGGASDLNASIHLFDAWKITMGDPRVIVSVHDYGVDNSHPDLRDNLWVNQAEYRGDPGVDDDGNGFIDDVYGYNFYAQGDITPGSHGTHVAGTIAAVNNNGVGVAGVAGGSGNKDGVRIMSCQTLGTITEDGLGTAVSYVYAANNGAVISQNSWSYIIADDYEQVLLDAIDYFIAWAGRDENGDPLPNTRMVGGLVVCAAGNDGVSDKFYPAAYEPCLAVSATGPWNEQAGYTNTGSWIDIAAPGGNTDIGDNPPFAPSGILSCNASTAGSLYGYMQGTSMACPHVSGVAALVLSAYGNEAYTPDMLRHRILSSVSTWEELGNPKLAGKLGNGLLNAAKALHPNENIAPERITDLRVGAESYDYITVRFTAPADNDNHDAHIYEIRYATENITAGNVASAKALFQLAQPAGAPDSVMIDHLQGETTYYVAIRSVDIWGNMSGLSNVITATTKQAPVIEITPAVDTVRLLVTDAVANPVGSALFTVTNRQGGDLRYANNYAIAERPAWDDNFKQIANFNPAQGFSAAFGEDGSNRFLAATRFTVTEKEFTLTHLQAGIISRGLSSNSSEAYYGKDFFIKLYKGGKTPADGKLISEFATSIPPRLYYFAYGSDFIFNLAETYRFAKDDVFWIVLDFPEGYLQPVTVNVATDSKVSNELYSNNAETWYELNKIDIEELPHNYAFRIFALDNTPEAQESLIAITPESGTLPAGHSATVTVSANAGKLQEGDYKGTLYTESNDPAKPVVHQPFVLTVDGHHKGFRAGKSLSLGSCVQGFSVKKSMTVYNDSLGILRISTVSVTRPQFAVSPAADIVVNPGDSAVFEISFTAPKAVDVGNQPSDSVGMFLDKITFTSNAITPVYTVTVDAISIERPIAAMDKTEENIGLHLTEEETVTFNLSNAGKYRLDYTVGSDRVSDYDYAGVDPADIRYYAKRNNAPNRFTSIASSGVDISKQLSGTKRTFVPLAFSFDAYGVKYDTLTLFGNGKIALGMRSESLVGARIGFLESDPAVIYPIYNSNAILTDIKDGADGAKGGHVYVQAEADKIIIEYSKVGYTIVASNSEISLQPNTGQVQVTDQISVQTTLYADGRIEFAYQDYTKGDWELNAMMGMSDDTGEGGLGIYFLQNNHLKPGQFYADPRPLNGFYEGSYIIEEDGGRDTLYWIDYPPFMDYGDNVLISIFPNQTMTKGVRPSSGSLLPGEDADISLTLQIAQDMREGTYERLFPIYTNDPLNDTLYFTVRVAYTSEPAPALDTNRIDFGQVGKGVPEKGKVSLRNTGGKAFHITSIDGLSDSQWFDIQSSGTLCAPFSSVGFEITFTPEAEQSYTHTITIRTDVGNFPLAMTGTGAARPLIEVEHGSDVWDITLTLAEETAKDTSIVVKNTGDAPLEYTILSNDWIKYRPGNPQDNTRSGYFWTDNKTNKGALFQWIWKNPKPFEPVDLYDNARYSKDFKLPWEFEFYGEKYDRCYVNASGMIYFEKEDVQYAMTLNTVTAGNTIIPAKDDGVNGFIAPLTGSYDLWYCYYEQVGEGAAAQMVFTWDVAPLGGSPGRMLFQAILSSDGSIKFQYKDVENALWRNRTTIGIENRAGDDGLNIAYMDGDYIVNGLAIVIVPGVKKTLNPGASEKLPFTVDASSLWDVGEPYRGVIQLLSNDKLHPEITTHVNLTVKGEVKPEYYINGEQTKTIDYGEVMRYDYPMQKRFVESREKYLYETEIPRYYRTVTIKNTGTKVYTLKRVNFLDNFILRDSISNPGGVGNQYLTIEPGNERNLSVEFNPITPNHQREPLGTGSYTADYIITKNSCEYILAQHAANPCIPAEYPHAEDISDALGSVVGKRYFTADTLHATAYIRDIPNQKLVSPCAVIDTTFDDYESVKEFVLKLQNPTLEPAYWRNFYNRNDKARIERQSELKYSLVASEITEEEYDRLRGLPPAKAAAGYAPSLGWKKTPEVSLARRTSRSTGEPIPLRAAASAAPAATDDAETFVDSLGYFNYTDVVDAYYLDADLNDRLTNYIRFKTAGKAFNLTHISMLALNLALKPELGYDVVIRIFIGEQLDNAQKVYETTINSNLDEGLKETIYYVLFSLSRPVYIEASQYVWIAIENTCNTGVMSLSYEDYDNLKENFMIGGNSFRDYSYNILGSQGKEGWGIFAWSGELSDGNAPWITLSQTAGTLTPGQSADIAVRLEPGKSGVELPNYYARIEARSNDPYPYDKDTVIRSPGYFYSSTDEMNIPTNPGRNFNEFQKDPARVLVKIHVNQGPQIIVQNPARVNETKDTTFLIKLIDEEGDGVKDFNFNPACVSKIVEDGDENVEPQIRLSGPETSGDTVIYRATVTTGYMATGRYTYELKSTDHKNKQSRLLWNVMVSRTYRKPAVINLPDVEVEINKSVMIDLPKAIIDYNNSPVTYTATVRHSNTAAILLINDVLTIFGVNVNTTDVRVKARNRVGQVDTFFNVTVTPVRPIGHLTPVAMAVGERRTIDLDRHFSDPANRGALSYTATSGHTGVAEVQLNTPTILTLNALAAGAAEITVTAESAQHTTVTVPFTVSVVEKSQGDNLVIYPNPATTALNLVMYIGEPQDVEIRIFSSNGALVYRRNHGRTADWLTTQVNVSALPAGMYIVQYLANGKELAKKRFVK